ELRDIGKSNRHHFTSTRLAEFFMELDDTYSDTFFLDAGKHLRGLKKAVSEGRLLLGAKIGDGLKGTGYILREIDARPSFSLTRWALRASSLLSFANSFREIEETAFS